MDNPEPREKSSKSPLLAAILSTLFPGSGFLYLGMIGRGVAYMAILAALIVALVNISEYHARELEVVALGLMIGGFYFFQIIDTFNAGGGKQRRRPAARSAKAAEVPSLSGSVFILVLGIVFQLSNLNMLDFGQIVRLWPLVLIGVGIQIMLSHHSAGKGGNQ